MSIDLPADLTSEIQSLVSAGAFVDETAVIRAAIGHLKQHRGEVVAILEGIADEAAGRSIALEDSASQIRSQFGFSPR